MSENCVLAQLLLGGTDMLAEAYICSSISLCSLSKRTAFYDIQCKTDLVGYWTYRFVSGGYKKKKKTFKSHTN